MKDEPHQLHADRIRAAGWTVTTEELKFPNEGWKDSFRLVATKEEKQLTAERKSLLGAWMELDYLTRLG